MVTTSSAPERADVVVVGGGLPGVLCAGWLAEAGVDVLLVEPSSGLLGGLGLGLVELGVLEYPSRTLAALGERGEALVAWSTQSARLAAHLGVYEATGVMWVPVLPGEEAEVARTVEALAVHGRAAEVVDLPALRKAGVRADHAALRLPLDGRLTADAAWVLEAWARSAGVQIRCGVGATRLDDGDGLVLRLADGSSIEAEAVVLTAGVGADALHPTLRRFLPVREQGLVMAGGQHLPPAGRAGQGWTGWRVDGDDVLVSGARWATPHLEVGETEPVVVDVIQDKLEAFAQRTLGLAGPVQERRVWSVAQSPDGLPVVGPMPGDPRIVGCIGFGATPAGLALAAARSVVDGLVGDADEVPWVLSTRRMVRWRYGR